MPNHAKNKIYLLFAFMLILLFLSFGSGKAAHSPDAIAIRVIPNPEHYSALRWYQEQGFAGSPQSLAVDGYEAVRDGRTVYVNAANAIGDNLYTNIYLISYNQDSEQATAEIFSRILNHWKFNTNIEDTGNCFNPDASATASNNVCLNDSDCPNNEYCNSDKAKVTRDTIRLARMNDIDSLIKQYGGQHGHYPILSAGTYLTHASISVWPSWQATLGRELEADLQIDPINQLTDCPGYDKITCWNEQNHEFAFAADLQAGTLPEFSHVFIYIASSTGADYNLCAFVESPTGWFDSSVTCNSGCIPNCFGGKECGDDSCGGECPPGCYPEETCVDGTCYNSCSTDPGCMDSLINGHIVSGYCAIGDCYQCNFYYTWNGSECVCSPDCSCAAVTCIGSTCADPVCGTECDGALSPDCSCADSTCVGDICDDGCGGICDGALSPDCSCAATTCIGSTCADPVCGTECDGEQVCACIPDCSCAAVACIGSTCADPVCGTECAGEQDCPFNCIFNFNFPCVF